MSAGEAKLVMMANQIARNFAIAGEAAAIAATAQHIVDFWDPRMKAGITPETEGLSSIASAALRRVEAQAGVAATG